MNIKSIFESTEIVLLVAMILPLAFILNVTLIKSWTEIALAIVMFLSIRPFFRQKTSSNAVAKDIKNVIISLILNYILLSGVYLLLASLFFPISSDYFIGYILLAMLPPAVIIIPLCYLTKCDIEVADTALVIGFLLALIIIPLTLYFVFGNSLNFGLLLRSLSIVILLPLILAYFTRHFDTKIFNYTKIINNLLIGLILVIVISLNRTTFLDITNINILRVIIINVIVIFVLGIVTYLISRKFVPEIDAIDYSLYATQKNVATGLTIAVLLFANNSIIPLIFALLIQVLYFMIFEKIILPLVVKDKVAKDKK